MIRRFLTLTLAILMAFCCLACAAEDPQDSQAKADLIRYGSNYRPELRYPEEGYLYGMCYLTWERSGVADYKTGYQLMKNLGVQSLRHWMHFNYYMIDYQTFHPERTQQMHEIIAEAQKQGFQLIGMSHTNWSITEQRFCGGKPARIPVEGSDYYKWLECYEETWFNVVTEFPEITIWEIDNEINNKDFMYLEGNREKLLTVEEMAAISADMLFYASRGIHRANPDAITVMGGIVDPMGLGIPAPETGITMVNYMEALYDAIDSGEHGSFYYDDFFQVACWHPYYYKGMADSYFVEQNNAIYEVITRREGKDKKVYLTEFGWNEDVYGQENITVAMETLYSVIAEQMPYVESLHYFHAFDNIGNNGDVSGMFYDPDPNMIDVPWGSDERRTPGAPKPFAYAYQEAAGGSGSLELLVTPLDELES